MLKGNANSYPGGSTRSGCLIYDSPFIPAPICTSKHLFSKKRQDLADESFPLQAGPICVRRNNAIATPVCACGPSGATFCPCSKAGCRAGIANCGGEPCRFSAYLRACSDDAGGASDRWRFSGVPAVQSSAGAGNGGDRCNSQGPIILRGDRCGCKYR